MQILHALAHMLEQPGAERIQLREEKLVAILAVVRPFLIHGEVLDARFRLHDPDFAASREPHQIGAAAIGERHFQERGEPMIMQDAAHPARERCGDLGAGMGFVYGHRAASLSRSRMKGEAAGDV